MIIANNLYLTEMFIYIFI